MTDNMSPRNQLAMEAVHWGMNTDVAASFAGRAGDLGLLRDASQAEQIKRLQGAIREITPLLDERLGYSIIEAWIDEGVITPEDMEDTDGR